MQFRRSAVLSVLLAGGLAGGTAVVATASAQSAAPSLAWKACPAAASFQCASVRVPLDYDTPHGSQIDVAVIRHVATDPAHRIGSLYWNPGGPGGAGTTSLPLFYSSFPATLRTRFDIVSFDPRGIGQSEQLQCFDTPEQEAALLGQLPPGGFPIGAAEERKAVSINAQFAAACARHGGPIQYHMSTANVARDMDRLRAALGDSTLDYYGTSYGTYLGMTYANLFPSKVGRIVLDGNVPPVEWNDRQRGTTRNTFSRLQSPLGTEVGLQLMLTQCGQAGTSRCAFSAASPAATVSKYRTLLSRVKALPVTVSGKTFTYAVLVSDVASGLIAQNTNPVTKSGWKELAALLQTLWTATTPKPTPARAPAGVLATLQHPSSNHATGLSGAFGDSLTEGTAGVLCSESPNPQDPNSYGQQARRDNMTQSPDGFGYLWAWLAQSCAEWQATDADRYSGPWNRSTKPYLVIGTLADSNTAYTGSLKTAFQLPNSRLLTETGGGHTALLNRSDCIDQYTIKYLISGSLPQVATICNQNRKPF